MKKLFLLWITSSLLFAGCSKKSKIVSEDELLKQRIDSIIPSYVARITNDDLSEIQRQEIICEMLMRAEMLRAEGDSLLADYFLNTLYLQCQDR